MLEADKKLRSCVSMLVEASGQSEAEVSRAIRGSAGARNFLRRKLHGSQRLNTIDIANVCDHLEISVESFAKAFLRHVAPLDPQSSDLQAPLDLPPSLYANLLKGIVDVDLTETEAASVRTAVPDFFFEPVPSDASAEPSAKFQDLIDRTNDHPTVAFGLAREIVLDSAQTQPNSPEDILEHASLVNAWACAALRIGKIRLGSALTAEALFLHGAANCSSTYPPLLRTAATFFHELGERAHAISTAQHALFLSREIEDTSGQIRSVLTLANRYSYYGMPAKALRHLNRLHPVSKDYHFRVFYNIALINFNSGDLDSATSNLQRAEPSNNHERLHASWLTAKILARDERQAEAIEVFEDLLATSSGHFPPAQRLWVFLDFVPLLRAYSTSARIKMLANHVLPDLERLEESDAARRLRDDVIAAATRGVLRSGLGDGFRKPLFQDS